MTLAEAQALGWSGERAERFVAWRNELDALMVRGTGLTVEDALGDWRFADAFDEGMTVQQAYRDVREQMREDGYDGE